MKIPQKDFNQELRKTIDGYEKQLENDLFSLERKYKIFFLQKQQKIEVSFDREGQNPFESGYSSSISLGIIDEDGELVDLLKINIWECNYLFLGLPMSRMIPGAKLVGELVDESVKEIRHEIRDYLEEFLQEDEK
ncbi:MULTISPECIES: hypothetical protein [unclassified Bacillus (in: firmicutes)]|uniref:hypothetical protein n=1 Tax=unclassified Bacillus (in: firmicutes) TaxID=185979 RepID=UPI0008E27D9C|nr:MULTISPECIES: hypothetical protein [unclassified Bacillus (in: firmicutes)]SFA70981.1 hypothetical protein SAMN02799634_101166 [Bacillus sp. UNCCL13]SFQ61014.1 hypothetical protein SAMN04488577_0451 [Bacillus sp. cl95]